MQIQNPYLSIIIPMYNESRYVARCLDSLIKQSYKDFELIMIDDGSTDNTLEIIEKYKKKIDNLTLLHQEHGGPGKARNRGAKEAKGEVLVFVDADMVFDIKYIEELTKPILDKKEIGTAHGREYVANKDNSIARAFSLIRLSYDPQRSRGGVFRAVRKDKFEQAGGFDTSKGYSDDDLSKALGSSLYVASAIAYHNNPESFDEIIKHSQRVGASLTKTGEIVWYLKKYALYLVVLFVILIVSLYRASQELGLIGLVGLGFGTILFFLVLLGIKRALQEGYLSHILYVPLVMICRGIGYISGGFQYLLSKKVY